eukprot:5894102-Ditylum_brightwellii.AAC.1
MGTTTSSSASSPPPLLYNKKSNNTFFAQHLQTNDDVIHHILDYLTPSETSHFLVVCHSISRLAALCWKIKADSIELMDDESYVENGYARGESSVNNDNDNNNAEEEEEEIPPKGATYWRKQYSKRLILSTCIRPKINSTWDKPPYWYPYHPEPSSPYGVVCKCHDVTEFRMVATSPKLDDSRGGLYRVRWRVNSTSGFCILHLSFCCVRKEEESHDGGGDDVTNATAATTTTTTNTITTVVQQGIWNTNQDRGS